MATIKQPYLFNWDDLEASSDLNRLRLVLDYLPDERIMEALEAKRFRGRDDYPIRPMWNALIAGVVFQHNSIASLIRELNRNPALVQICGFNPIPVQKRPKAELVYENGVSKINYPKAGVAHYGVPEKHNFSRFLNSLLKLEEESKLIEQMVIDLRNQLMTTLPDFGEHLGYDGKAIESHSTGVKHKKTQQTSDQDADWGKHETTGIDKDGNIWKKIKSWFGYELHLIADTKYEIPVKYSVTRASVSEQVELRSEIKKLFKETPELAARCKDFSADRGLDSGETKALLWDEYQIRPLIDIRELWRAEKQDGNYDPTQPITRQLFPDQVDNIVYTEKGRVICMCPKTGEQHDMAFCGFEADRNSLKYRCPAATYDFSCAGEKVCRNKCKQKCSSYGRIVRIDLDKFDRRIFTPTPYGSPSWQRGYNRRSALERINNRVDNSFCFEKHYIRGKLKMQARCGIAIAIMMAMALGHLKNNCKEQMRSLVSPIPPPIAAVG